MKKLLFSLFATFAFFSAEAQYYYMPHSGANPGSLNSDSEFPVGGGLPAGWTTLFSGTASTTAAPVWSNTAVIPFSFSFNGQPVTNYKVSSTGVLTFTTSATTVPSSNNAALPHTSIPNNSVMVWGLFANAGDFITTKTFGTAPNRQHWVQFNSYSQTNNSNQGYTYWSIVLEETTNNIHIVDQRAAGAAMTLTVGVQINGTTAFQVAGSPNLNSQTLATASETASDNVYYSFLPGTRPMYDMAVAKVTMPNYLILANAPFAVSGTINNFGSATVTSFDLNYSVNGGAPVVNPLMVSIPSMGSYNFNLANSWTPATVGAYTIEVWATNINGNLDMVTANDSSTKQVSVVANTAPRTVLHEVFTSSTCNPCTPANANLRNITKANPGKSIDIKYQQNFPGAGDPYQSTEAVNRRVNYYGISAIPHMEADGGWDKHAGQYTPALLNSFHSKPALIQISGTHTVVGNTVTMQAVIDPIGNNIPGSNLVLHRVITEKFNNGNIRTNGETEFFDVMKKMLPNENGLPISGLSAGTPLTFNTSHTFQAGHKVENFDSLQVVIFVQDAVTKEVLQATYSQRTNTTAVSNDNLTHAVVVYPNPSSDRNLSLDVKLENTAEVQVNIVNALGQVVYVSEKSKMPSGKNTLPVNLKGQANGIYFVKVAIGENIVTKKISLTK